jgi:hypothetical protein
MNIQAPLAVTFLLDESDDYSTDDQTIILLDGKPTAYSIQHCWDPDNSQDDDLEEETFSFNQYTYDENGELSGVIFIAEHLTLENAKEGAIAYLDGYANVEMVPKA